MLLSDSQFRFRKGWWNTLVLQSFSCGGWKDISFQDLERYEETKRVRAEAHTAQARELLRIRQEDQRNTEILQLRKEVADLKMSVHVQLLGKAPTCD